MTPRAVDPPTITAKLGLVEDLLDESLAAATGLRLLVHHYGRVDHDRVAAAVPSMARDARRFVAVSRWLLDRG